MKSLKFILFVVVTLCVCVTANFSQTNSYNGVTFSFKLTNGVGEESKTSFNVSEEIVIKTNIINNSSELFPVFAANEDYLYKFSLTRADEQLPIAYRSDRAEILSVREEDPGVSMRLTQDPILPSDTEELATLKLSDRYGNLTPGNYKLRIEYKTGKILQINGAQKRLRLAQEIAFEVVP